MLVVVFRVVNQTVVGKHKPVRRAEAAVVIDVAFVIHAPGLFGKKPFAVAEHVAADAHPVGHVPEVAFLGDPSQIARLGFGDVVLRQNAVCFKIARDVVFLKKLRGYYSTSPLSRMI